MHSLADDPSVVRRILDHIDNRSTDRGAEVWHEPVENYRSEERLGVELTQVLRRTPTPFCPSAALPDAGSYVARTAAGVPLIAVRDRDGVARVFRNACRHRGMALAEGAGCKRVLVCPYHAWTYELDGRLRGVPHQDGFPGLDKRSHGLVPVASLEDQGLVWVTQDGAAPAKSPWAELDGLVTPAQRLAGTSETDVAANWKIVAEGFLEGYHLQSLHADTFFPIQFDNLNVIEQFGPNSRVTFPYRRVNRLRDVEPGERSADGVLTYVYHLFPNVMLVTFSKNTTMIVIEPTAVDRCRLVNYTLTHRDPSKGADAAALDRDLRFIEAGTVQDREAAVAIQRGLASGANETFQFGLFESAIVHFHRTLHGAIAAAHAAGR
jgi:phenylpropionate dioxygenase-like ring-hydroxylating dioxygenase large terminal subunit